MCREVYEKAIEEFGKLREGECTIFSCCERFWLLHKEKKNDLYGYIGSYATEREARHKGEGEEVKKYRNTELYPCKFDRIKQHEEGRIANIFREHDKNGKCIFSEDTPIYRYVSLKDYSGPLCQDQIAPKIS